MRAPFLGWGSLLAALCLFFPRGAIALPAYLGDLDGDGQITVLDLARLLGHLNGSASLPVESLYVADLDQDGAVSQADADLLTSTILGAADPRDLPLTGVLDTSPAEDESDVALTRETVIRLTRPLAADTTIGKDTLYAEAGGRRLLTRAELSSDRKMLTLFYLENLPSNSEITVVFDSDGLRDAFGGRIDARGNGLPGSERNFQFTTVTATADADTAIVGRVLAAELEPTANPNVLQDHPLEGVRISVDGQEETLFTVTDAAGNFRLDPAPAGRFFVHIDGRTGKESAWPNGGYYPFVGKAWETIPGVKTNLAGGNGVIYLPFIAPGTLQPVSPTTDTQIRFPAAVLEKDPGLAGVSITVPANSLFSENGTRGGQVGIAPVPPNRLPSPLPPGLDFPVVITVQTDGPSNFDRPAPARFPNQPLPQTGQPLPPGAKSALWSFNHDTGEWELQGQMTVSPDGKFVETDPGVGIRQPGWHGSLPASRGKGGPIKTKKKKPCATNGQACDDGDPCTTDDRCQGGVCRGDPPKKVCPGVNDRTQPEFQWTEEVTTTPGNVTSIQDLQYDTDICYDEGCGGWQLRVVSMTIKGHVKLSNAGSTEPNPVVGGNVTAQNYCEIVNVLTHHLGRGKGKWHTLEATRAHEYYHRDVEYPQELKPHLELAERAMESMCVPCSISLADAAGILQEHADSVWSTTLRNIIAEQREISSKHDTGRNDEAYQAGAKVLNDLAERVRQFAQQQGFPPCSPLNPPPALAFRLVELRATIRTNRLDVGQQVQIQVTGVYSDGSTKDLTAGATGTTYTVLDSSKASVGPNGLLEALKPGGLTVAISHPSEGDYEGEPVVAEVSLTVRSPLDLDGDGLPDEWEAKYDLNPSDPTDADQDRDADGLTNREEYRRGTDPTKADTDGDGVLDGAEVRQGTNPLYAEDFFSSTGTVEKGLHFFALLNLDTGVVEQRGKTDSNGQAFHNLILAPDANYRVFVLQAKSGLADAVDFRSPAAGLTVDMPALLLHKDTTGDADHDGLPDLAEFILGTDPQAVDSDGDGVPDGTQFLPDQYTIEVGQTVGNGVPAVGAGRIERPGAKDYYSLTAPPGQVVFLSLVSNTVPCCVEWTMEDDEGNTIFNRDMKEDVGRFVLDKGGQYTLTVGGGGTNQTGEYAFKFWDATPQQFQLNIGDAVTNGVPAVGAGNIETPGATDVYSFTARTNQQIFIDFKEPAPTSELQWSLEDEGTGLSFGCFRCLNPGVLTLRRGGTYKLTIGQGVPFSFEPTRRDTETYGFKLWDVPPPQQFAIQIGDIVSDGKPAPGAGNLETPGVRDIYTFEATAGQEVFFQVLGEFQPFDFMGWRVTDPTGAEVFDHGFNTGDPGVYTLEKAGTYTILVEDRSFFTSGPYSFQTWNIPPASTFAIQIGDTVKPGQPGPGAGQIESPGAKDIYKFSAAPGTKVAFNVLDLNPSFSIVRWYVTDEAGKTVFDSCLGCGNPGTFTLEKGGIYTITVGSRSDPWVGTYQFEVKPAP